MLGVLALAVALWGLGHVMGAPLRARLTMIGALWAGVVMLQLTLPDDAALRAATGGGPAPWLMLGALAGMAWGYGNGLGWLRRKAAARMPAEPQGTAAPGGAFRPEELERYARHIMLRELGGPGQQKLRAARVLVVGAGGLGSPALLYLAAAGVGRLGVIDDDVVEASNLQRQIIHAEDRLGMPKVFSAQIAVAGLNRFVDFRPYNRRLTADIAADLFADYDLILDGTDNFDTRELVNATAVATGRPLISAAMTQWEGQIGLYDPARGGPCYACVFPRRPAPGLVPSCAEAGVVAPLPGVIGAMMALEAVKHLTGAGGGLRGRILVHDALWSETRSIATRQDPACAVCGKGRGAG